jgi:hypothetical protein
LIRDPLALAPHERATAEPMDPDFRQDDGKRNFRETGDDCGRRILSPLLDR